MIWKNTANRYGLMAIGLHWLMLLLLIVVYASIEMRELFPKGSDPRAALKTWHLMLGLSIFALVWLRLAIHLSGTTPRVVPAPSIWQRRGATFMHFALYAWMIGMPLGGWLLLSATGKPTPFFGLQLPALIGENKDLADLLEEIHETGGTVGYFLIAFHSAAALFHHYVSRDNTLVRMLPEST